MAEGFGEAGAEDYADITVEQAIAALWSRGELSYKLHEAQLKIYEELYGASNKLYVANCSRRFGKSFLMVLYAIERALRKPKTRIRFGAAFQTDLTEYILPAFELILEDCPNDLKPVYRTQGSKYVFQNGSEIKLFGVDKNPNSARGNAIDVVILDEAAYISNLDYLITSVVYPAQMYKKDAKLVLISTPPVSPDHDFKMYCDKAKVEGNYSEFTIYDNPMIGEAELRECIEDSGGKDSTTFKREFLCQFVTETERAITPEFKRAKHVYTEPLRDDYTQFYRKYASLDLGFRDLTALLYGYYDFKRAALVIEDEFIISGPDVTSERLAKATKDFEKKLGYENTYRISDNSDLIFLNDLQSSQDVTFMATSKDSLEAMVNELREWLRQDRIRVADHCIHTIGCLESGIWDKNRKKFDKSKVYGHYDALASLIYMVRNIHQHDNPVPFAFQKDIHNWEIRDKREDDYVKKQGFMKKLLGI